MAHQSVNDKSGASKPRSVDSESCSKPTEPSSDAAGNRIAQEFQQAIAIGDELIGSLKAYTELLGLEALLAFKSIPALLASWLLLLPAMLLTWLSFSALLAWVGFSVSGIPVVGFGVFFVMQLLSLLVLWFCVKRYRRRLSLPESRQQLKTFIQGVRHEFSQSNPEQKSRAQPPES
ncbi:hypothetical protein [Gilvimarinus polysaccharolyticus]|uniref:hypothetical protein n=1 Tax=Gilvimarinus polysaccharolyticus TaxID=863921 RepID=UPI000673971E|nr:hypothetical protein [Gilvimarinus polysaccharolyticus]